MRDRAHSRTRAPTPGGVAMIDVRQSDSPAPTTVAAASQGPLAVRVARSTATQAALMLAGALASLLALRVASRHLGPDRYGAVAAALALVTLLGVGADLGLGVVGARQAVREPEHEDAVVLTLALLRGALGIVLAPVAVALGALLYGTRGDAFTAVVVLCPALPMMAVQAALGAHFVARGRNALNIAASTLTALTLLGGALAVATWGLGTSAYAVAVLVAEALGLLAVVAMLLAGRRPAPRLLPAAAVRRLIALALPLAAVQVLNVVYLRVDVVMLGAMRPAADVGDYSVGYQVVLLVMALPSLFMTALLPALATADVPRLRLVVQRAVEVAATAALPILLVIVATAPVLIAVLSADRFQPGARALQILALGAACSYGSAVYGNAMVARGLQRRLLGMTVLVVALNVALNLVLIPRWGTSGAASAMAVSELLALVLSARIGNRALGLRPRRSTLVPPFLAAAVAGVVALVLSRTALAPHDLLSATVEVALLLAVDAVVLVAAGGLRPFQALLRRGTVA